LHCYHLEMTGETDLARIARIGDRVFAATITLLVYRVCMPCQQVFTRGELSPLLDLTRGPAP